MNCRIRLLLMLALFAYTIQSLRFIKDIESLVVSGRVICNGRPARILKVSIDAEGPHGTFEIAKMDGNKNGTFFIAAQDSNVTSIIPKVYFYHTCNSVTVCYKKFGITIPESYITIGNTPQHQYDIGTVELGVYYPEIYTYCIL